ncbi:hypothetical protein [Crocinitomix algicola]|uniref:hypothetical protein n=1 Tax=Crocinitomix algicola TaxID=1740263 RepID=UPI001112D348|nr:hypothetical protein [Crocinitomix algicola]
MDNIEKFEKMKEISRLRGEYYKQELLDLVGFKKDNIPEGNKTLGWLNASKLGFDLYKQIKKLIE